METENIQFHESDIEAMCYASPDIIQESNDDSSDNIYLTSKECEALESWGYVILNRNNKRYMLDSNGIRELINEFDLPNISNEVSEQDVRNKDSFFKMKNVINQDENSLEISIIPQNSALPIEESKENVIESIYNCNNDNEPENSNLEFASICVSSSDMNGQKKFNEYNKPNSPTNSSNNYELIDIEPNKEFYSQETNNTPAAENVYPNLKRKYYMVNKDDENNSKSNIAIENILEKQELNGPGIDKLNKFYLGDTPQGKKLFGRIIDFRPPNGAHITKTHIENLKCEIKNGLSNFQFSKLESDKIVASAASKNGNKSSIQTLNREKSQSTNISKDNLSSYNSKDQKCETTQKIKETNQNQLHKTVIVPQNEERYLDAEESEQLAAVKDMITLLIPMSTDIPIINRNLMIYKAVNPNMIDSTNFESKSYVFTGRAVGSDENGWSFSYIPELALQRETNEGDKKNFLIIRMSLEEGSDGNLQNVIIMENKDDSNDDESIEPLITNTLNEEIMKAIEVKKKFGRKYYECTFCKHYFYGLTHFKRHIKIHRVGATDPLLQCHHCECTFTHESTLTRHIVEAHRNTATYSVGFHSVFKRRLK